MTSASTAKGRQAIARILDAAERVVAEAGHEGATTRRIAAEAGVDKRVLSYYFGSREALLAEVVGRAAARVAAATAADLQADPHAVLQAVWRGIVSEPALVRTYISMLGTQDGDGQMAAVIDRMSAEYRGLLRRALADLGHAEQAAGRLAASSTVVIRGLLLAWAEGAPDALVDDTLAILAAACALPAGGTDARPSLFSPVAE